MNAKPEAIPTAESRPRQIGEFQQLRSRLLECIADVLALERSCALPCAELREKVETNTFNLVVVGQFKRGKTYLINALMGADLLPVSVVPLTSIVTVLSYGEELRVMVFYNDGQAREADPLTLSEYVTEAGNPNNMKNVKEVIITYPSPYLKDGVRLIDTPGVGSVYVHNTDVAYRYLPKSDAALFLLSVDQPVSKAELEFLADVRQYSGRIFFLLNKIDHLTEDEIEKSIVFSRGALEEVLGGEVRVYPVSAKLALQGKLEGAVQTLKASRIEAFAEVLNEFLLREKGKVLLLSVANSLARTMARCRLEIELELQSILTPLEALQGKIARFDAKKEEIIHDKQDLDVLLDGEVDRLIRKKLDEDLAVLKKDLIPQMEEGFDRFHEEHRELSLKELSEALEKYVTEGIERAFLEWCEVEEETLAKEFEAICSRFVTRANETVDELMKFSSQLFAIPFSTSAPEPAWAGESGFYLKFRSEAVGLDLLTDSLTQVAPGYISDKFKKLKTFLYDFANRLIVSKRRRHMLETIEMQSGRLRFDFLNRIDRGRRRFRSEMMKRIDATMEGIGAAIALGMDLKSRGEKEVEALNAAHGAELARLEGTGRRLAEIIRQCEAM